MAEQALSDLKVIEYANYISGPFCAKLMADLGAEVIKIEAAHVGDVSRQTGPFPDDVPHSERSGLFLFLNTNKRSITLNPETSAGARIFKELVKTADVLIENTPPSTMEKLSLSYETLSQLNPGLVMTSITPFGQSGPYAHYKADDLVCCHMSGIAYHTPYSGIIDLERQPPLKPGGHQSDFVAGSTAGIATMFAVIAARATGIGQHIDLSQQESIASVLRRLVTCYTFDPKGIYRERYGSRISRLAGIDYLPCKDGYVANGSREEYQWRSLLDIATDGKWEEDERIVSLLGDEFVLHVLMDNFELIKPYLTEWTMKHTKDEITALAQARGVPIVPCNSAEDMLNSVNFAAREFFVEIEHPEAGKLRYPGAPFRLSETPWRVDRPAPLLGQHNEEIFCGRLSYSRQDLTKLRESGVI